MLVADNSIGPPGRRPSPSGGPGPALVTIYPSSTAAELASRHRAAPAPALVIAGSRVGGARPGPRRAARAGGRARRLRRARRPARAVGEARRAGAGGRSRWAGADLLHVRLDGAAEGGDAHPRGLLGAASCLRRVWHLGADDATLVCLPLAWAFGLVTTSMATLRAGGRVVVLARADPDCDARRDGRARRHVLRRRDDDVRQAGRGARADRGNRPDLSQPAPVHLRRGAAQRGGVRTVARAVTGCPVHDVYAASECFPVVTYDPVSDPQPRPGAAGRVVAEAPSCGSIGRGRTTRSRRGRRRRSLDPRAGADPWATGATPS